VSSPIDQACENCRFYDEYADDPGYGNCRRRAPLPLTILGRGQYEGSVCYACWPLVGAVEWCGEYEPDKEKCDS